MRAVEVSVGIAILLAPDLIFQIGLFRQKQTPVCRVPAVTDVAGTSSEELRSFLLLCLLISNADGGSHQKKIRGAVDVGDFPPPPRSGNWRTDLDGTQR